MKRDQPVGQLPPSEGSKREELQRRVWQSVQELCEHMGNPDSFVMPVYGSGEKKFLAFGTPDSIAGLLGFKPETATTKGLFDDDQSSIEAGRPSRSEKSTTR